MSKDPNSKANQVPPHPKKKRPADAVHVWVTKCTITATQYNQRPFEDEPGRKEEEEEDGGSGHGVFLVGSLVSKTVVVLTTRRTAPGASCLSVDTLLFRILQSQ